MVSGVKAVYSNDYSTITTYAYPKKAGYSYKLTQKTWKNKCPTCGREGTLQFVIGHGCGPEGTLVCGNVEGYFGIGPNKKGCDADFCAVSGKDTLPGSSRKLTPATVTPNSVTTVAESQTQTQYCSLSKAEALTKAQKGLSASSKYKGTLKIPALPNLNLGDLLTIRLDGFEKNSHFVDSITEDIDNETYTIDLLHGRWHFGNKYDGSYVLKNKDGAIINASGNILNAECSTVNVNIGLKDNSTIAKKIRLKGQSLGTVDNIYKWLRVTEGGGTGGWSYLKYGDHRVASENRDMFGPLSATQCWDSKTANCADFSWIMAMMGNGAGKEIGIKRGTYDAGDGSRMGHMWNYSGTKYYDCSSKTKHTIDWQTVEDVK